MRNRFHLPENQLGMRTGALIGILISTLGIAACSDETNDSGNSNDADAATYFRDIKPIMERYCTECHTNGEIAPFSLTSYDDVLQHAPLIQSAVTSGLMPPWLPSDASLPLRYSREMRAQDKQLLLGWLAAGAPAGDANSVPRDDLPLAESELPPRADVVLKATQPYHPDTTLSDDYHCFIFDPKLDHDQFLQAGQIYPDNRAMVHHVVLFLIQPDRADAVRQLDPTGNGYTCFGGPGANVGGSILLAWAPGGSPMRAPADSGFRIPKGALLVMQMHYNLSAANGEPDQTNVALEVQENAPAHELASLYIMKRNLMIKAGDMNSVQATTLAVKDLARASGLALHDFTVYGAFPHMHVLGKRITLSVVGGAQLLEIPRWDFHWQSTYSFVNPVTFLSTDSLNLECDYDNSADNQPLIMGQRQVPRDVSWGESTFDEMCLAIFTVTAK